MFDQLLGWAALVIDTELQFESAAHSRIQYQVAVPCALRINAEDGVGELNQKHVRSKLGLIVFWDRLLTARFEVKERMS